MSAMIDKSPSNALAKLNSQVGAGRNAQGDLFARPGSSSQASGFRTTRPLATQREQPLQAAPQHLQHQQPIRPLPAQSTPQVAYPRASPPDQHYTPQSTPQHSHWTADYHAQAASVAREAQVDQQQQRQLTQPSAMPNQGYRPMPSFAPFKYRPFAPALATQVAQAPLQAAAPTYAAPIPETTSSSLAQTAALLVDATSNRGALDHETAEKLGSSDFMALMRDFAAGRKDVHGEEVVDARVREGWASSREGDEGWAQDFSRGIYGSKGKARDLSGALEDLSLSARTSPGRSVHFPNDIASPYTTLSDADLRAATSIPASSMRWEEDLNDDQTQEAFFYYNGPLQAQQGRTRPDGSETAPEDVAFDAAQTQSAHSYVFQKANPWQDERFAQAQRAAALDADSQQEAKVLDNPNDAHAWLELGIRQQENEREQEAISALERSIAIDPTMSQAYLSLAVSHTNNSDPAATFRALEAWVESRSQSASGPYVGILDQWERQTGLDQAARKGLAMKAMEEWLSGALIEMVKAGVELGNDVDGDLQVALGVLFNTSGAYSQAQDCFRTALAVRPDDYQLYNRLGATLANGGKADEAYELYWRALELRPGFVRARFNLGISCINLKRYEEAAEHVLTALRLQQNDSASGNGKPVVGSATLWDTLRNACAYMHRPDLVGLCQARDLGSFEGIDFTEGGSWDGRT